MACCSFLVIEIPFDYVLIATESLQFESGG